MLHFPVFRIGTVLLHGHASLGKKSAAVHFARERCKQTRNIMYVSCADKNVMESEIINICT